MSRLHIPHDDRGFTLIELMLSMSLFIFVMIVATVGFVGINRTFTKGLARKQLSESVQRLAEDITTTINNDGGLNSSNIGRGQLCSSLSCYVWAPYSEDSPDKPSGLRKVTIAEADNPNSKGGIIIDERYKVDRLDVARIGSENLYRVSGIIRTADKNAFNFPDDGYPELNQNITCKGSAQEGASTSCSLEKFSFVVRAGDRS